MFPVAVLACVFVLMDEGLGAVVTEFFQQADVEFGVAVGVRQADAVVDAGQRCQDLPQALAVGRLA
ncbi:MAG: hypothetical protein P8178_18375 [Candidatus Thiodiazotropha sp.]